MKNRQPRMLLDHLNVLDYERNGHIAHALAYFHIHQWVVIPIRPRTKIPAVRWKPFQKIYNRPSHGDCRGWWRESPEAGVGLVLGPASNVFAIDVDSEEAHNVLVAKLGGEPKAPKFLSGSRKPYRYQLLFRHPEGVETIAKITPWHPQLEFRGQGGLSILPPSIHPSGQRYAWANKQSINDLALTDLPPLILEELRGAKSQTRARSTTRATPTMTSGQLGAVQTCALAHVENYHAIEGQDGDRTTFTVACFLVREFGLSAEDARPVLAAWNTTNAHPAWSNNELEHKLQKADDFGGKRGTLRREYELLVSITDANPKQPTPFFGRLPDWVLADMQNLAMPAISSAVGRPTISNLAIINYLISQVVMQKQSRITCPDVALAQLLWSGDQSRWPERWRFHLRNRLGIPSRTNQSRSASSPTQNGSTGGDTQYQTATARETTEAVLSEPRFSTFFCYVSQTSVCGEACPLHGTATVNHMHYSFNLVNYKILDLFKPFRIEKQSDVLTYNFLGLKSRRKDFQKAQRGNTLIAEARKQGRLAAVYLPAWTLACIVFETKTCCVLHAITRELTRARGPSREMRGDRAEIVVGSNELLLDATKKYVCFNGNIRKGIRMTHGQGYGVKTWLERSHLVSTAELRSEAESQTAIDWRARIQNLFTAFEELQDSLGVVTIGKVRGTEQWLSLTELQAELGYSSNAKRFAKKVTLKVFGPENYLELWRDYFAQKADFTTIPSSDPNTDLRWPKDFWTPESLARWMKQHQLTDAALAEQLKVDRTCICRMRTGARPIRKKMQQSLTDLATKLSSTTTAPTAPSLSR